MTDILHAARVLLVLPHESAVRRSWTQYLQAVPDLRQCDLELGETDVCQDRSERNVNVLYAARAWARATELHPHGLSVHFENCHI